MKRKKEKKVKVLAIQFCLILCDPRDCSPPGSSVHGILQARILEWVDIPFSRGSSLTQGSNPSLPHCSTVGRFFTVSGPPREVKVAQVCLTLCDPMDRVVHGILQARMLEWVAIPFSRESSQPRDRTQVSRIAGGFFTS